MRFARRLAAVALATTLSLAGFALAQDHGAPPPGPARVAPPGPRRVAEPAHAAPHAPAHEEKHAAHEEHESGPPGPFNLFYGLIGEQDGLEAPNLFFRPKGMQPPFAAAVINFGVLLLILVQFGSKPLADALTKRKADITKELDEAAALRAAAEKRLGEYRDRLGKIESEIERVRADFREQGERDCERIIRDAEERRALLKKDAEFLLAQEIKQLRLDVTREAVDAAVVAATELVAARLSAADHERFADAFIAQVASVGAQKGAVS